MPQDFILYYLTETNKHFSRHHCISMQKMIFLRYKRIVYFTILQVDSTNFLNVLALFPLDAS
jgi:uncharacterized protein YrrD